jgi:CO/xanthine dehydrogenase Mo-binding subunit
MTNKILKTENETWGFYGTMSTAGEDADQAWEIAMQLIAHETGCSNEAVRRFLDSRDGRHFADQVSSRRGHLADRIGATIVDYRAWKISPKMQRECGIPAGMPYLDGWCGHYEIELDEEANA